MIDLAAAVRDRLVAEVSDLRMVSLALDFAALVSSGQLPQRTPAAFVLSTEVRARPDDLVGAEFHDQEMTETISVVLVVRHAGDAIGARNADALYTLREAVRVALAGWVPDGVAAMQFSRSSLRSLVAGGVAVLELTFTCEVE